MPLLVKPCRTRPTDESTDGAWNNRWTVCPSRRLVRPKHSQGYFGPFLLHSNPNIRRFDLKSLDFSQFKPRNIIKTYLSQIIKSKLGKLEVREEKKLNNPSSRTPQAPQVPAPKLKYFFRKFHHKVYLISLWVPFPRWVPTFKSDYLFSFHD